MSFDAQTSLRQLMKTVPDDYELNPKQLERDYVHYDLTVLETSIEFEGLDKYPTIPPWRLMQYLLCHGCAYVHKYTGPNPGKWGADNWYVCPGGLGGEPGPDGRPLQWIGANGPLDWSYEFDLDDPDGCFIRCDTELIGVLPKLRKWARLRAAVDVSIYMGTINTRLMTIVSVVNENTYEAAKQMLEDITSGKLNAIVHDKFNQMLQNGMQALPYSNAQGANMMRENVEVRQYLEGMKWADLGISAAFNMKREAINSSESELNDNAVRTYWDNLFYCLTTDLEKIGVTPHPAGAWKVIEAQDAEIEAIIENPEGEEETDAGENNDEAGDERVSE